MSRRYKGGFISTTEPTTSILQARGIWTLDEQAVAQRAGLWPTVAGVDANFKQTTLLLTGDGTNGAQNNTFIDSSTNAFAITRTGTPTQGSFSPFSPAGWSGYFGTGNNFSLPQSSTSWTNAAFTVEALVYVTASGVSHHIFSTANATQTLRGLSFYRNDSLNLVTDNAADGASVGSSTGTVTLNQWNHVAITLSAASGTIAYFINGVSSGTSATGSYYNYATTTVAIGTRAANSTGTSFTGYISNLRFVLGTAIYTGAFTPPTAPLTAITGTSLLTLQDNRFKDNSANNFTFTRNGAPSIQAFSPFAPLATYSPALHGGSGYFSSGGTDYLNVSGMPSGSGTAFTLECGVFLASSRTHCITSGSGSGSLEFYVESSGAIKLDNTGIILIAGSAAGAVPFNQWVHITLTRTSGNLYTIYVNGTSVASGTYATSMAANTTIGWHRTTGANYFNGYISNFRVVIGSVLTALIPTSPLTAITGTSLLLNFANAGIADATSRNDLATVGNAQVSTAAVKWGTGSIKFGGVNTDYILSVLLNQSMAVGAVFTIEAWVYPLTHGGTIIVGNATNGVQVGYNGTTSFGVAVNGVAWRFTTTTIPTLNAWNYIAIVRTGTGTNQTSIYINSTTPTAVGTVVDGFTVDCTAKVGETFNGYVDDLRVTRGIARTITAVPTQAFPVQ